MTFTMKEAKRQVLQAGLRETLRFAGAPVVFAPLARLAAFALPVVTCHADHTAGKAKGEASWIS